MNERLFAWLKKARVLRERYDANEQLFSSHLLRLRPRWAGYRAKEAAVVLYLQYKLKYSQEILYRRFIEGYGVFLSPGRVEGDHMEKLREIAKRGTSLLETTREELRLLQGLPAFTQIERTDSALGKSVSSTEWDEARVRSAVQTLAGGITDISGVKRAHKHLLDLGRDAKYNTARIRGILEIVRAYPRQYFLDMDQARGSIAATVYATAYVAYFFGIINYDIFSPVTSMAREVMMLR